MRQFQVVGRDGSVMGDVMGYDDDEGDDIIVSGPRRGSKIKVMKPSWRGGQLAPGVQTPDEGLIPLPLRGEGGTNTFTAAVQTIIFAGAIQKPFRGERILVSVVRTGASATGRILALMFIGTDLQQADINGVDVEQLGNPNAFGVRLTMSPAQPGVLIRLSCTLSTPLAGADTIQANMQILGRAVF